MKLLGGIQGASWAFDNEGIILDNLNAIPKEYGHFERRIQEEQKGRLGFQEYSEQYQA